MALVQLYVSQNLQRPAKSYRSVAQVTCRRAGKGFEMKYNPGVLLSIKNLTKVQDEDWRNTVNVNRDDASGFRLDTMTTVSTELT